MKIVTKLNCNSLTLKYKEDNKYHFSDDADDKFIIIIKNDKIHEIYAYIENGYKEIIIDKSIKNDFYEKVYNEINLFIYEYNRAIKEYSLCKIKKDPHIKKNNQYEIWYYNKHNNLYDKFIIRDNEIYVHKNQTIRYFINRMDFYHTYETIDLDPLYRAAIEDNDDYLIKSLELYYKLDNKKTLEYLESIDGIKRIPSYKGKQEFIVSQEDINKNINCLLYSGYMFWFQPSFGMNGKTRDNYTILPNSRKIVNASPIEAKPISFLEFINILEKKHIE